MPRFKQLINPHQHSDASLDGAATIKQIVKRSQELGASAVAITEHGNINSAMEHYTFCKKAGIVPILGIELYVESPFKELIKEKLEHELRGEDPEKRDKKIAKKLSEAYVHLTVHFKTEQAYKYFCALTPKMDARAVTKFFERKPIITLEELYGIAGQITIGSGCLVGFVQKWVMPWENNRTDMAERAYCILRELAGPGNFFVELFPHKVTHNWQRPEQNDAGVITKQGEFVPIGCNSLTPDGDIQRLGNSFVLAMARKYKDPVIVSLDAHFALPQQKLIQDARLGNGKENWRFYNSYHIYTTDEIADELKHTMNLSDRDIEEMVDNSYQFADLFKGFKLTTGSDRWVLNPLEEDYGPKLKRMIDRHGRMNWKDQKMVERLRYEISVLANNGKINLLSYFFTVEDIANFCRENDVLINVRGSAGGSLLLYLIGVSAVNPLKHNLSFERFLTLGRIKANTLPDVDMDISTVGRDQVLNYLELKYGDRICRLSTDSMLKLKSSIKDAERSILGAVRDSTEAMCKTLPMEPQGSDPKNLALGYTDEMGVHHRGTVDTNDKLKEYAKTNPEIWQTVVTMLGIQRQKSVHACGVIIADKPIQEYCPIITVSKTKATGFSPKSAELAGLVKYDLLGLNTLRDIQICLRSIRERLGVTLNPWDLPFSPEAFAEFCAGKTETVFQFDTDTVRPYLINIRPKNIDELAAITSLCRPGTLDAPSDDGRTLAQVYVARRNGESVRYVHDDLEPILKETEGIQLYQEQTLQIFRDLAGMTYEEAELVRRGIGKKDEKLLAESTGRLKSACLARGWTEAQVNLLIEQIMASARYSFNKSHAVSYAYVAYACMYLKTHYPLDWWKACLSNANKDELATKFWKFVHSFTELPDINNSSSEYVIRDNKLIAPISVVNGIGEKAYAQLLGKGPYSDIRDFVTKHFHPETGSSGVHSGIARKLIVSGITDRLFPDPNMAIDQKLYLFEQIKSEVKGKRIEPVPAEYTGLTALGRYLIKKELISVYSEDLRDIMLPTRGGKKVNGRWVTHNNDVLLSGDELQIQKQQYEMGFRPTQRVYFCVLGYVVNERTFTYKGKAKQATELLVDVDGRFFKEVIWPRKEEAVAPSGFADTPVLINYIAGDENIFLRSVVPMIDEKDRGKFNLT